MNKKLLSLLIGTYGILGINQSFAENLLQIYREAESNDATFASAKASYEAGKEGLAQAKSQLLPQINASSNITHSNVEYKYNNGITPKYTQTTTSEGLNLSARQSIFNQATRKSYEQAEVQFRNTRLQLDLSKQDLVTRVVQAYFDALLAKDNVVLATAQKNASYELLQQAKRSFEVGLVTIVNVHESQRDYDKSIAYEISAVNNLEIKMKALRQITGRDIKKLAELKDKIDFSTPKPASVEQWIDLAEKNAIIIEARKNQLESAGLDIQKNKAGHLPTLDLVANIDYTKSTKISGIDADTHNSSIALQLNIPIFQGGLVNSRVREAVANKDKASYDLEASRRESTQKIYQYFSGVNTSLSQIKAFEQAVISSEVSLKSSKIGLEVGVRTSVDVLNALRELYDAKRSLAEAKNSYIINLIGLKATSGTLEDKDLESLNQLLKIS